MVIPPQLIHSLPRARDLSNQVPGPLYLRVETTACAPLLQKQEWAATPKGDGPCLTQAG